MSAALIVLIAVAGALCSAIAALCVNARGFSELAGRMDSLERRMAVVESYTRQKTCMRCRHIHELAPCACGCLDGRTLASELPPQEAVESAAPRDEPA